MNANELNTLLSGYIDGLIEDEKAPNTIRSYAHMVKTLGEFLGDAGEVTKRDMIAFKNELIGRGLKPSTVNQRLNSMNKAMRSIGHPELVVKTLVDTTANVLDESITEADYAAVVAQARLEGNDKYELLIETLAATGIRVGELRFITVESLERRVATATNKGKTRYVFIPRRLAGRLADYASREGITSGPIFLGRGGRPLADCSINQCLKRLAARAGMEDTGVMHPHSFRHLFTRRLSTLAGVGAYDIPFILGHSTASVGVTGIYAKRTTGEYLDIVDRLEAAVMAA